MHNFAQGKIDMERIQRIVAELESDIALIEEKLKVKNNPITIQELKEDLKRKNLMAFDYKRTLSSIKYE